MSRLQAWLLATVVALSALAVTALAYGPQRASFAGRCVLNGRALADCHCMAGAYTDARSRRDLPPVYAQLTKSWAHDAEAEYRSRVYSTVFWQSVRAVPVVREVMVRAPSPSADGIWECMAKTLAEEALKQISQRLGVAIVPLAFHAKTAKDAVEPVWEFAKAQAIVSKHCGGRTHGIVASIESVNARVGEQIEIFGATVDDVTRRAFVSGMQATVNGLSTANLLAGGIWWYTQQLGRRAVTTIFPGGRTIPTEPVAP